jgi:hypothetical protein
VSLLYPALGHVRGIDFGQDTDWELAARLFPNVEANCILFPAWLRAHSPDAVREELGRLMRAGLRFPRFSFSVLEVDTARAEGRIFEFDETFRACAEQVSWESA